MHRYLGTILLILFLLCASNIAFANDVDRNNRDLMLLYEPTGITGGAGQGLKAGLIFTPSYIVEASINGSHGDLTSWEAYNMIHWGLTNRVFIGRSFNLNFGVGGRRQQVDYDKYWDEKDDVSHRRYHTGLTGLSRSFGAQLSVGNQWQFGWFTLGCDWFGFYQPMISTYRIEGSHERRDEALRDLRGKAASTSLYLLKLHVGAAF